MAKNKQEQEEAAPDASQVITENQEQTDSSVRYVVIREGHRVSPTEYDSETDPKAVEEQQFWEKVAKNHSWNEPVQIVKFDNKLHRVW